VGERVVKLILPAASPGSGGDTTMRAALPALSQALGSPAIIENQPAAAGIVGTGILVRSPPDGYTLGVVSSNHVINPAVYKSLPFDPIADITPIAILLYTPFVIVVNPAKLPVRNAQELIAMLRAKPGYYNYGSSGNGTSPHLAVEMFLNEAGVKAVHVPYKGTAPVISDLIGGQVDFAALTLPSIQQHLQSGSLRAVGVASATRLAAAPEIPTMIEQGIADYVFEAWYAVIGPAKMPPAEVKRIHAAFAAAFATPELREAMAKQGNTINVSTPETAVKYFSSELDKYAKLVKIAGIQLQ
jgi:tripartite-type tricarboxylate transporter receptor subunit TctC